MKAIILIINVTRSLSLRRSLDSQASGTQPAELRRSDGIVPKIAQYLSKNKYYDAEINEI